MENERIKISKEAVTALDNLVIGIANATSVWADEAEVLTNCMISVKENVGPFAEDYEKEILKLVHEQKDLFKRLSLIALYAVKAREYINDLLAKGGSGNP